MAIPPKKRTSLPSDIVTQPLVDELLQCRAITIPILSFLESHRTPCGGYDITNADIEAECKATLANAGRIHDAGEIEILVKAASICGDQSDENEIALIRLRTNAERARSLDSIEYYEQNQKEGDEKEEGGEDGEKESEPDLALDEEIKTAMDNAAKSEHLPEHSEDDGEAEFKLGSLDDEDEVVLRAWKEDKSEIAQKSSRLFKGWSFEAEEGSRYDVKGVFGQRRKPSVLFQKELGPDARIPRIPRLVL